MKVVSEQANVRLASHLDTLSIVLVAGRYSINYGSDTSIALAEVAGIVTDSISATLLITRSESREPLVFTFREGDPDDFIGALAQRQAVKKTTDDGYCRMYRVSSVQSATDADHGNETVFDMFAKITHAYTGLAKKVLAIQQPVSRPDSKAASRPRNPWIVPRRVHLSESLFQGRPLTAAIWASFHDAEGIVAMPGALKRLIHLGGAERSIRRDVWLVLLDVRKPETTNSAFLEACWSYELEYTSLRNKAGGCESGESASRIERDVLRIEADRALPSDIHRSIMQRILAVYCLYDPEIEYVQGMCDLLAPILHVIGDEYLAFWAFVALMRRMRRNFLHDSASIQRQLDTLRSLIHVLDPIFYDYLAFERDTFQMYFCYRWLLVLMKREFAFEATLVIWEVAWSSDCPNYHLFVALALLYRERESVMTQCARFEDILSYFNRRAESWSAGETLALASQLYEWLSTRREARQAMTAANDAAL